MRFVWRENWSNVFGENQGNILGQGEEESSCMRSLSTEIFDRGIKEKIIMIYCLGLQHP